MEDWSGFEYITWILIIGVPSTAVIVYWLYQRKLRTKRPSLRPSLLCYVKSSPQHDLMGADNLFLRLVSTTMRNHGTELDVRPWVDAFRNSMAPVIIVCPVTSRVGSNIEHTLKGIKLTENMALLLFHPVATHVRPPGNTEDSLLSAELQALGSVVDVVYTPQDGVYDCSTNTFAVDKMCSFLRRY